MWRRSARTWGWRTRCREATLRGRWLCLVPGCAGWPARDPPARSPRRPRRSCGASLPRLVSTDELARWQAESTVVVLDVRTDVFAYLKGHLPGAEYLNTETLRASEGGIPTRLLSAGAYRELFSRLGVDFDRPVVIYSAGESRNIDATFLAWLLAGFGHPQRVRARRRVLQVAARAAAGGAAVSADSGRRAFPDRPFHPEAASLEEVQQRRERRRRCWSTRARPTSTRAGRRADAARAHPGGDQPLLAGRSDAGGVRARVEAGGRAAAGVRGAGDHARTRTSSPTATAPPRRATSTSRCGICWAIRGSGSTWARGPSGPRHRCQARAGGSTEQGASSVPLCRHPRIAIPLRSCPGRQIRPPRITSSTASRLPMSSSGFLLSSTRSA